MNTLRRFEPTEGWLTLGLLAALIYATLKTVETGGWCEPPGRSCGLEVAPLLGLLGVGIGLLTAKSAFRPLFALAMGWMIGLEALIIAHALIRPEPGWTDKLAGLSQALRVTPSRMDAYDQLFFAVAVGGIGYLLGFLSSWLVFRHQSGWWPFIGNSAAGLVHLSYASLESVPPYLLSIFLGVLMVASLQLHARRGAWQGAGVSIQGISPVWSLATAATLAGLALAVAGQLPAGQLNTNLAENYQSAAQSWRGAQEQVDRLFGAGRGQARPGGGLAFSQSLSPRENFELGSQPVLRIASPQRRYWRTVTYDRYDGRSIQASGASEHRYGAGETLPLDPEAGRLRLSIEQHVTVLAPAAALFAPDAPVSFSLPALVDQRQVAWDVAGLRLQTVLQAGQSYTVTSLVPQTGRREMEAATSTLYPPWTERYLELPMSLPERVGQLANQLTAEARNPLDRALAIEDHLRAMTYSTTAVVPPVDRDWVDYLLFDSQSGYCDYFATAMTVMLRTQGIPARVASGFAPGLFDPQQGTWLLRESEAHSWTEAYFPGFGWLTFEPSALRSPPERPESIRSPRASPIPGEEATASWVLEDEYSQAQGSLPGGQAGAGRTVVGLGLGSLAIAILVMGLAVAGLAVVWERGLTGEPVARRRFGQLQRCLDWSGWKQTQSTTPLELAARIKAARPEVAEPASRLIQRHVEASYRLHGAQEGSETESETAWRALRRPLWIAVLRRRLGAKRAPG